MCICVEVLTNPHFFTCMEFPFSVCQHIILTFKNVWGSALFYHHSCTIPTTKSSYSTGYQCSGVSYARLLLTFKGTHTETPPYLSHLLIPYYPSHVLMSSSSSNPLRFPNLIFSSCSFLAAALTVSNCFLDLVHSCNTFNSFLWHLKAHFPSSFQSPLLANSSNSQFLCDCGAL